MTKPSGGGPGSWNRLIGSMLKPGYGDSWGLEQGDTPREPAVALRIRGRENPVLEPEFWGTEEGF